MLLTLALLASAPQLAGAPAVYISASGSECELLVDGQRVSNDQLDARAAAWEGAQQSSVRVVPAGSASYRCIGAALFLLQKHNLRAVFVQSDPGAPAHSVLVPAGRCRVALDGKPKSFEQYLRMARHWAHEDGEIHFEGDPHAAFRCVDRALSILRRANVTKLGYIGNDAAPVPVTPVPVTVH